MNTKYDAVALMEETERALRDSLTWYMYTRSSMAPSLTFDAMGGERLDPLEERIARREPVHKAVATLRVFRRMRFDAATAYWWRETFQAVVGRAARRA